MKVLALTWEDVHRAVIELWKLIEDRGSRYDIVVPIARGGCTIGQLLSDLMNTEMIPLRISSYTGTSKVGKASVVAPPCYNFRGKSVLLVDDVCDTGDSIEVAKKLVELMGVRNLETLVVAKKPSCKAHLDYWIINTDSWVLFPWEVKEVSQELRDVAKTYLARVLGEKYARVVLGESESSG